MFENPRRGRQARNFTTNVPKILDLKSSSEQMKSFLGDKNMPISTVWILKYVQQCYVKWFWTISSLGAPVGERVKLYTGKTGALVFFFFVNISPALYYLNAWNRLIWHLNFPRTRALSEPASSLQWALGSLSSVVVDVAQGLRCHLWRHDMFS